MGPCPAENRQRAHRVGKWNLTVKHVPRPFSPRSNCNSPPICFKSVTAATSFYRCGRLTAHCICRISGPMARPGDGG